MGRKVSIDDLSDRVVVRRYIVITLCIQITIL